MNRKHTPWFSGDIKPVHEGVYEKDVSYQGRFQYWCGDYWCGWHETPDGAVRNISFKSQDQDSPWRGLAEKP